jgi:hypothetical protein
MAAARAEIDQAMGLLKINQERTQHHKRKICSGMNASNNITYLNKFSRLLFHVTI